MYKPKVKAPDPQLLRNVQNILTNNKLTTVCEAAACPNRTECYQRNATTFMILGDTCTRACAFCNVKTGKGSLPDVSEPARLAKAIQELRLKYVVITSVDRDDLKDYGSKHFANCVFAIKEQTPDVKIELLTPDFKADKKALDTIINAAPYKLAHNQECVERLSPTIRPQSSYKRSLEVLEYYANNSNAVIKSSLMLGLGESENELRQTMQELLNAGVTELTLGQYLQPTKRHHKVEMYYPQSFFDAMKVEALCMGFHAVASGILVRSSYFADELSY
jgi:lipoic acid synthetase